MGRGRSRGLQRDDERVGSRWPRVNRRPCFGFSQGVVARSADYTCVNVVTHTIRRRTKYLDSIGKYHDLQAYLYLAMSAKLPENISRFVFYYTAANEINALTGNIDVEKNCLEICLKDEDVREIFIEYFSKHTVEIGLLDESDTWVLGEFYDRTHRKIIDKAKSSDIRFDKSLIKGLGLIEDAEIYFKDTLFHSIKESVLNEVVIADNRIFINKSTLDRTLEQMDKDHIDMIAGAHAGYAPQPSTSCKDCEYRTLCINNIIGGEDDE